MLLFFIILLGLFKFVDNTFEMCMFLVDISLCTRHNILRQAKLPADRKGIAGPRYTNQKPDAVYSNQIQQKRSEHLAVYKHTS